MEQFFTINVIGAATIIGYLVGMIWYSPVLSMKWYLAGEGITKDKMPKRSRAYIAKVMVYSFILHAVLAVTLSLMLSVLEPTSMEMALVFSSLFSVGIIVITRFIDLIYSASGTFNSLQNQKKFLISSLYYVILFAVMTVVMYYLAVGNYF